MNRLWIQLSLGFALVTLVATLTVALLAGQSAEQSFRNYLARSQATDSGLLDRLAAHYAASGSWAGAELLLTLPRRPGQGQGQGHGAGPGMLMSSGLALADRDGRIIADPQGVAGAGALQRGAYAEALPIMVDGRTVGYLLARPTRGAAIPAAAQSFLDGLSRTIWGAGLLAGGLGLALGLLIARGVADPLGQLAVGAQRIAQGRLDERVPVRGPAEVGAVALAFNEMAASLEASEGQRRQMVADIAHELRTPLTVVQGNLRAILDDVYPLSKGEVATIYEATLGLRRLVEDLRELSLAEAGRLELRPQALAVAPLLEHEVALFAELAAGQGVTLTAEVAPGLPAVRADPERLGQVLHNLVSNALRHTPDGGTVSLRACAEGAERIRFEVVDSGVGIAPEDLPHLFDRFYRADRARSRAGGGSGLGLAITRELVRLHGGVIVAESAPGQGARFWFSLPAA